MLDSSLTGMVVKPQYSSGFAEGEAVAETASPEMTLLYISGHGMVFKSKKWYEAGTRLAVGMFLRKIRVDLGIAEHGCTFNGDHFLNLKGVVADCKIVETSAVDQRYQVTLLFQQLGDGDRVLLRAIEQERKRGRALQKPVSEATSPEARAASLN